MGAPALVLLCCLPMGASGLPATRTVDPHRPSIPTAGSLPAARGPVPRTGPSAGTHPRRSAVADPDPMPRALRPVPLPAMTPASGVVIVAASVLLSLLMCLSFHRRTAWLIPSPRGCLSMAAASGDGAPGTVKRPKRSPPRPLQSPQDQLRCAVAALRLEEDRWERLRSEVPGLVRDVEEHAAYIALCERNLRVARHTTDKVVMKADPYEEEVWQVARCGENDEWQRLRGAQKRHREGTERLDKHRATVAASEGRVAEWRARIDRLTDALRTPPPTAPRAAHPPPPM